MGKFHVEASSKKKTLRAASVFLLQFRVDCAQYWKKRKLSTPKRMVKKTLKRKKKLFST